MCVYVVSVCVYYACMYVVHVRHMYMSMIMYSVFPYNYAMHIYMQNVHVFDCYNGAFIKGERFTNL